MDPSFTQETRTQKSWAASSLKSNHFSSSISKIPESSTGISNSKRLHLYFNIEEIKTLIHETSKKSQLILESVVCEKLCGKTQMGFPKDRLEHDEVYNCWLVNINNEMFNLCVDEPTRYKEQRLMNLTDDTKIHLVDPNKKKDLLVNSNSCNMGANSSSVKVVSVDDKAMGTQSPKMSFHMNWIPKPQDEYKIVVNNVNQPFQHVWLQMSEDGSRFIHPLEKLSLFDFVDKNVSNIAPVPPPPVETTPLKLVQDVRDLKELVSKLHYVNEFAVDLEHNQYRSFQGLTCLMQISTRTEDFIVDTLKLRVQIGPYLREVFKDPTKKKVMHGADKDILWLQRDFGIYVCNMFDTGQASRVLKMERNSLDYLLRYFCGVATNKEYQTADWRFRPLTEEMLRYARVDTHYLLYIYDLMKIKLFQSSMDPNHPDALLVEVYQRSFNVCMQLYEKDVLNEYSYLNIYGLHEADLNGQQLAIVAALCEWRDVVARVEDESTGYVLPNKILLEIAKKMPVTNEDLRGLLKFRHPHIGRYLTSILSIIQQSMQNASEFEGVARRLKEEHLEMEEVRNEQKKFEEASVMIGEVGAHSGSNVVPNQFGKKAGSVLHGVNRNYQVGGSSANVGGNWNAVNRSGFTNTKPLQNWGANFEVQKNTKQQQIKSPFNFPEKPQPLRMAMKEPAKAQQSPNHGEGNAIWSRPKHSVIFPDSGGGRYKGEKAESLSGLSSSFQKCLQISNKTKMTKQKEGGGNGKEMGLPQLGR